MALGVALGATLGITLGLMFTEPPMRMRDVGAIPELDLDGRHSTRQRAHLFFGEVGAHRTNAAENLSGQRVEVGRRRVVFQRARVFRP